MKQDDRAPFDQALQRARVSAYAPGEFVEQESFMRAGEIRTLAARAGIAPGVRVLDLCCGVAGPGRFITQELGCTYLGVDFSSSAIDIARQRAGELPSRFEVARIPPVPRGPFDVVLLLEAMLAFPEKETLLHEISRALTTGGRFAFTMEEGVPLTEAERASMPDADTIWLTALPALGTPGVTVQADATAIAAQIGRQALDELMAAHRLWSDWLRDGRVRKIAFVAEKTGTRGPPRTTAADVAADRDGVP